MNVIINHKSIKMKDILVVAKLKEGKFEKFMGFMQSEEAINERKKIADVTKTIGTVSPVEIINLFIYEIITYLHHLHFNHALCEVDEKINCNILN